MGHKLLLKSLLLLESHFAKVVNLWTRNNWAENLFYGC